MRILFSADPELPVPPGTYGGVQRLVDTLLRFLKEQGHTVGLVAHPDSKAAVDKFYPWPGKESQNFLDTVKNTATLWRAVKDFKPDLLHSFSRLMYMLPLYTTKLPLLMTYGRIPGFKQVHWASSLAGDTLSFTSCSDHIRHRGEKAGGKWFTVYNFVELELFDFKERVADDAPLVFLSRLDRVKGAHTAIEIAKASGKKLIVAGNHASSGPDAEYFEKELRPMLDLANIQYIGPVNDVKKNEILGQAAALIVPIEWEEPFGIVFIEALACGTPVITCPRGAVPEILEDGVHGFCINSAQEGVAAVNKLSSVSRSVCRKRVEEAFSASIIFERYVDIYNKMIKEVN